MKKPLFFKLANILTCMALGICYVELLKLVMHHHIFFPSEQLLSPLQKMVFTGTAAIFSTLVLLLLNLFVTRQNSLYVGCFSALAAFIYFYNIKSNFNFFFDLYSIITTNYSLFAMFAFLGTPILVGFALNKAIKRDGFQPPLI